MVMFLLIRFYVSFSGARGDALHVIQSYVDMLLKRCSGPSCSNLTPRGVAIQDISLPDNAETSLHPLHLTTSESVALHLPCVLEEVAIAHEVAEATLFDASATSRVQRAWDALNDCLRAGTISQDYTSSRDAPFCADPVCCILSTWYYFSWTKRDF